MARTHSHLVQHQFKKSPTNAAGAPSSHQEGKPTPGAPKKAVETPGSPATKVFGNEVRGNSVGSGRNAAIQILLAGRTDTKKPAMTKNEIRKAPATGQAGSR